MLNCAVMRAESLLATVDPPEAPGRPLKLPALPLAFDGARPGLRHNPPAVGADGAAIAATLGYTDAEIDHLRGLGVIVGA